MGGATGWSPRQEQLGRRAPRAFAPAHGAEGTGSGSEMAASMFYSRLLATTALRSRGSRPALRAAAQVLRPRPLSLRGSAGGRARWETWLLWVRCEGMWGPARGHFAIGDIGWHGVAQPGPRAACPGGLPACGCGCVRAHICAALLSSSAREESGHSAAAALSLSEGRRGGGWGELLSGGVGAWAISAAFTSPSAVGRGFRGPSLGRGEMPFRCTFMSLGSCHRWECLHRISLLTGLFWEEAGKFPTCSVC